MTLVGLRKVIRERSVTSLLKVVWIQLEHTDMNIADELLEWRRHWRLGGGVVHCRQCGAVQREDDRDNGFSHHDGCRNRSAQNHPWNVLDGAIERVSGRAYSTE